MSGDSIDSWISKTVAEYLQDRLKHYATARRKDGKLYSERYCFDTAIADAKRKERLLRGQKQKYDVLCSLSDAELRIVNCMCEYPSPSRWSPNHLEERRMLARRYKGRCEVVCYDLPPEGKPLNVKSGAPDLVDIMKREAERFGIEL